MCCGCRSPLTSASGAKVISILFVCLGNYCRSPCLEAVMRHILRNRGLEEKIYVDSCALYPSYLGKTAHPQVLKTLRDNEIHEEHMQHKARMFSPSDLELFDYIFAADYEILTMLKLEVSDPEQLQKIYLATAFSKEFLNQEMNDPYYGGREGFEKTFYMAKSACEGIIDYLLVDKNRIE